MDAFTEIFDAADSHPEPMDKPPRRNSRGRAIINPEPTCAPPAPDAFSQVSDEAMRIPQPTALAPRRNRKTAESNPHPSKAAPSSSPLSAEKPKRQKAARHTQPAETSPSDAFISDAIRPPQPTEATRQKARTGESDHGGQGDGETQTQTAAVIAEIQALWRMRQRWHRAEKALIQQSKAFCRALCDGDKDAANNAFDATSSGKPPSEDFAMALMPFLPAIERFQSERKAIERQMEKAARVLPTYEWATSIRGLAAGSFVAIIGEAGDIGARKTVSQLWKFMGLAVISGERQRKKADVDLAALHAYSPARRSVMWNVGGALIGGMGHGPRPLRGEDVSVREDLTEWQKLFIERCRYLAAREPEKFAREPVNDKKTGEMKESYSAHCAASAKRYVEKRFLRKLYARWRFETRGEIEPQEFVSLPLAAE